MKRFFLLKVAILLILCITLIACTAKESIPKEVYETYTCGTANDGIVKMIEKSWWSDESYTSSTAAKSITISVLGTEYTGAYDYTLVPPFRWEATDYYTCQDGVTFGINAVSGEIRTLNLKPAMFQNGEISNLEDLEDPQKQTYALAVQYASFFINPSSYTLIEGAPSEVSLTQSDSTLTLYQYEYVKYVDKMRTPDRLYIQITSKGTLAYLALGTFGAFDSLPQKIIQEKYDAAIVEKIQSIYKGYDKQDYTVEEQTLTYTPDGKLVIMSQIVLSLTKEEKQAPITTEILLGTIIG